MTTKCAQKAIFPTSLGWRALGRFCTKHQQPEMRSMDDKTAGKGNIPDAFRKSRSKSVLAYIGIAAKLSQREIKSRAAVAISFSIFRSRQSCLEHPVFVAYLRNVVPTWEICHDCELNTTYLFVISPNKFSVSFDSATSELDEHCRFSFSVCLHFVLTFCFLFRTEVRHATKRRSTILK